VTIVNLDSNKVGRFWRIARRLPDIHFLAVRGGYGFQIIPRRIPRNVEVLEHVPSDRMDELVWSRTALLLMPSLRESWGMTATEALQRGIPVIAHPTPGLRESLGDAGIFVDRADWRTWSHYIRTMLADPGGYARRSEASRRRARELVVQSRDGLAHFVRSIEELVPRV
jgi:glycosyltransferase involved in cell wall biosynthesis